MHSVSKPGRVVARSLGIVGSAVGLAVLQPAVAGATERPVDDIYRSLSAPTNNSPVPLILLGGMVVAFVLFVLVTLARR